MSPFEFALGALLGSLHAVAAGPAVYRGTRDHVAHALEIDVAWGETEILELTAQGDGTVVDRADAIVHDYRPLLRRFGVPQRGDTIEQGGIVRRVLPHADGDCYAWSGASRQALRIHTKIVEET